MHLVFCTSLDAPFKISFAAPSVVPLQITCLYLLQCKIDLDIRCIFPITACYAQPNFNQKYVGRFGHGKFLLCCQLFPVSLFVCLIPTSLVFSYKLIVNLVSGLPIWICSQRAVMSFADH
jgi:hypothetical protein